jgi:hypothetical protein
MRECACIARGKSSVRKPDSQRLIREGEGALSWRRRIDHGASKECADRNAYMTTHYNRGCNMAVVCLSGNAQMRSGCEENRGAEESLEQAEA